MGSRDRPPATNHRPLTANRYIMACAGCTVKLKDGQPIGCRSNGNCSTGGCNRLNTFDWLSAMEIEDVEPFNVVEVSFKNGSRKGFYYNQPYTQASTGDIVIVESQAGSDGRAGSFADAQEKSAGGWVFPKSDSCGKRTRLREIRRNQRKGKTDDGEGEGYFPNTRPQHENR